MERLTTHDKHMQPLVIWANQRSWEDIYNRLMEYEDMNLSPQEFKESVDYILEMNKKLKPFIDAEANGKLFILPCAVGDIVYKVWYAPCHNGETFPDGIGCDGCFDECDIHKEIFEVTVPSIEFIFNNIMKKNTIYFLTREEAEKALN